MWIFPNKNKNTKLLEGQLAVPITWCKGSLGSLSVATFSPLPPRSHLSGACTFLRLHTPGACAMDTLAVTGL